MGTSSTHTSAVNPHILTRMKAKAGGLLVLIRDFNAELREQQLPGFVETYPLELMRKVLAERVKDHQGEPQHE